MKRTTLYRDDPKWLDKFTELTRLGWKILNVSANWRIVEMIKF